MKILAWLAYPLVRYFMAWGAAVGIAAAVTLTSWTGWDDPQRADGNAGHTRIDFGGQWVMGRMLVRGHGHELYSRSRLRQVLREAYPPEHASPNQQGSDADNLMSWMMGSDDEGVGGPLYPPVNAFVFYPLGLLPPQPAYRVQQLLALPLALLAGLGIRQLSEGRMWWPVAMALILIYPGFYGAQLLGQNSVLTLALLVWGWVLFARGRDGWGGAVWGLLAFKPVWAAAFFLVPLLTRRWRACLTMLGVGAALVVLTLPAVGVTSWLDWLKVGRDAAAQFDVDKNWIELSRDLLGVPRRYLLDFEQPRPGRESTLATAVGWALLLAVLAATAWRVLTWGERARATTGPCAAFVLLGAWLCCFHFMYYDVLLTALPVLILLAGPRQGWAGFVVLLAFLLALLAIEHPLAEYGLVSGRQPLDTFVLLGLWAWCGLSPGEPGASAPGDFNLQGLTPPARRG